MPVARPELSDCRVIAHVDMDCFYVQGSIFSRKILGFILICVFLLGHMQTIILFISLLKNIHSFRICCTMNEVPFNCKSFHSWVLDHCSRYWLAAYSCFLQFRYSIVLLLLVFFIFILVLFCYYLLSLLSLPFVF